MFEIGLMFIMPRYTRMIHRGPCRNLKPLHTKLQCLG